MVLGQGRITDEGVAQLKSRIGSYFKGEYVWTPNYVMTKQAIAHWCDGMGDFNNKLYRDEEYAKKTRYGSIIAPPISLNSIFSITGMRVGGLPGVHSFHSGWDWLWLKPVKVNEPITWTYRPVDIVEKKSEFALRTVIIYAEGVYRNQRDEIVAKNIGWSIRAERGTARDQGKYRELKPYWTDEEMQKRVEYLLDHEEIRGATPRYWEDVKAGDELPTLVKGPLSIGEMWAWSQGLGGGGFIVADHKILMLSDTGELVVGQASPAPFTPISRARVLGQWCWTAPTLANGRVYCRNNLGDLVCLDLKGP
jgi:acyl dehydratase